MVKHDIEKKLTLIIVLFCLLFMFCTVSKEDMAKDSQKASAVSKKTAMKTQMKNIPHDSLLKKLLYLEDIIMQNPADTEHIGHLIDAAYDSEAGLFYCAGKGTINPEHPVSVQKQDMRRAAKHTGERWALYLKAWQSGRDITLDKEISGKIMTSTLLFEMSSGDTLYQLLSIPSVSVEIQPQ